jgi:sec-independent protein translocase protein TatC
VEDREIELSEHLEELRTRLIRSVVYIGLGAVLAWFLYDWIYGLLTRPLSAALEDVGTGFIVTRVAEGFMIRCQMSLVAGAIFALPLVTLEAWGFVAPALTKAERKPLRWIAPLTVLLFAGGVALAYSILPIGMKWFTGYVPKGAKFLPTVSDNILFIIKMLLAFGLVFELPVVLMFLGKLGVINSRMLRSSWRYGVVGIALLAAVVTPSSDAFSMLTMAIPLVVLYLISIWLVKIVEPK